MVLLLKRICRFIVKVTLAMRIMFSSNSPPLRPFLPGPEVPKFIANLIQREWAESKKDLKSNIPNHWNHGILFSFSSHPSSHQLIPPENHPSAQPKVFPVPSKTAPGVESLSS